MAGGSPAERAAHLKLAALSPVITKEAWYLAYDELVAGQKIRLQPLYDALEPANRERAHLFIDEPTALLEEFAVPGPELGVAKVSG